jgi:hypothetical protein
LIEWINIEFALLASSQSTVQHQPLDCWQKPKADAVAGRKRLFVLALKHFSLDLRIFSVTFYFSSYNAKCRSFSPVPFTQVMSILAKDDLGSFVLWI